MVGALLNPVKPEGFYERFDLTSLLLIPCLALFFQIIFDRDLSSRSKWFTPEIYLIMLIWHIFPSSSINVILICNYVSTNALLREIDIIQIVVIFPNCFLNWFSSQYSKNEIFKAQNIPSHEHLVDLGPCQPYLGPFPVTCWVF